MTIKEINLKNFRCIKEQNLTFNKGIILISGDNGEGKSSLFNAIEILLFNNSNLNLSDYIKWNEDEFFISIKFNLDNTDWYESFTYSKKKGSDRILKNLETNEEYKNSIAINKLDSLINFNLAYPSIVSNEGEINLINTTPSKRREYLKEIYNLEFKEQLEEIQNDTNAGELKKSQLQGELTFLENQLFEYKELIPFEITKEEYENVNKQIRELSKYESLILEKDNIVNKIKEYDDKIEEYSRYTSNINALRGEFNELNKSIKQLNEERNLTLVELNNVIEFNDKELSDKKEQFILLKKELEELKNKIKSFESGKCPVCNSIITPTVLEDEKEHLKEVNNKVRRNEIEIDKLNAQKLEIEKTKEGLNKNIKDLDSKIKDATNGLNDINLKLSKIESLCELIEDYKKQKENYTKQLEEANNCNLDLLKELKSKKQKYEETELKNKFITEFNEDQNKKKKERDEKLKTKQEELLTEDSLLNMFKKSKVVFTKEFPSYVMSKLISNLQRDLNEFLNKVYPKYNITIKESKDSLAILYGENEVDVKQASGFEKSIFSISYMYSLGKLKNYNLLLLDESDGTASEENSIKFFNALAKSQNYFNQIFLISHKKTIQEYLKNDWNAQCFNVEKGVYNEW